MSYPNRSKGSNYGNQRQRRSPGYGFGKGSKKNGFNANRDETKQARENFESRSKQSQIQDLVKMAPLAPNIEAYLKTPEKFDWANVDGVDPKLVFSHKTAKEQAMDLARVAEKAQSVEVWLKNTAQSDLEGVDTPKSKAEISAKTRKFKVVRKEKAKEETEKELKKAEEKVAELAKSELSQEPTENKRKLPTVDEIYAEAVQMWQKENHLPKHGDMMENIANPTRAELKEEGYLNAAKLRLMTSEDTEASRKTFDYVDNVRQELERIGFTVVPMEGFSSEDLQF